MYFRPELVVTVFGSDLASGFFSSATAAAAHRPATTTSVRMTMRMKDTPLSVAREPRRGRLAVTVMIRNRAAGWRGRSLRRRRGRDRIPPISTRRGHAMSERRRIVTAEPENSETPLERAGGWVTPTRLFF